MIKVEKKINLCPNDFGHSGNILMLEKKIGQFRKFLCCLTIWVDYEG
jgi:hypothetical protein